MLFNKKNLFVLDVSNKKDAIKLIAQKAFDLKITKNKSKLERDLNKREEEISTGFEDGVSIPHTQSSSVLKTTILIARYLNNGIEWGSVDGRNAKVSICILVPEKEKGKHIQILGKIAESLLEKKNRDIFKTGSVEKVEDLIKNISNSIEIETKEIKKESSTKKTGKIKIVAVTSCIMGIAHTYMAARALENEAKKNPNIEIKVERRGSSGKENALTESDISHADFVLLCADANVTPAEFPGKKVYHVGIHEGLKHTKEVLEDLPSKAKLIDSNNLSKSSNKESNLSSKLEEGRKTYKKSWVNRNILSHMMEAVGKIVPLMLCGGLLIAIARLSALAAWGSGVEQQVLSNWNFLSWDGVTTGSGWENKIQWQWLVSWNPDIEQFLSGTTIDWTGWFAFSGLTQADTYTLFYQQIHPQVASTGALMLSVFNTMGNILIWLMIPFWAIFIARSIGGPQALIPGLIVGLLSAQTQFVIPVAGGDWSALGSNTAYPFFGMSSGVFGAMFGGFAIGHFVKYLNDKIRIKNENYVTLKTMLIIPLLASTLAVVMMLYALGPLFGMMNQAIIAGVTSMADNSAAQMGMFAALATIIAFFTAFDLGGPINKAASSIAFTIIAIPGFEAFGLTARTIAIIIPPLGLGLATLMDRLILGKNVYSKEEKTAGKTSVFLGFMAISEGGLPFLFSRPVITIISSTTGAIIGALIAVLGGSLQSLPLPAVWGWPLVTGNAWMYFLGLAVGVLWTATLNILWRWIMIRKGKYQMPEDYSDPIKWKQIVPSLSKKVKDIFTRKSTN